MLVARNRAAFELCWNSLLVALKQIVLFLSPVGARDRADASGLQRIPVGVAHAGAAAPRERQRAGGCHAALAGDRAPGLKVGCPLLPSRQPGIQMTECMRLNIVPCFLKHWDQV